VPELEGITEFASGYYHACTRSAAGAVQCFGDNAKHQLGSGTSTESVPGVTVRCDG
jgi:hypothetical protein